MPKTTNNHSAVYDMKSFRQRVGGISQGELANILGISTAKISRIEKSRQAGKEIAWACYGYERYWNDQQVQK